MKHEDRAGASSTISVRIAHAEARDGEQVSADQVDDPRGLARRHDGRLRLAGFLVVLADDTRHRALTAWLARSFDVSPLPTLLDRDSDDIWTTASPPEELAARLVAGAGGSVTAVEISPVTRDPTEVTAQTCTARIEFSVPPATRHITARLDLGLALATVTGAEVRVPAALMDRLAVPVPGDDPAAPFRRPPRPAEPSHVILDRRAGRVLHVTGEPSYRRPRFKPRNMRFRDGLDRWDLGGGLRDGGGSPPPGYRADAEGQAAVLSSAVRQPEGSAVLMQAVFADDFRGATAVFRGEFRTEDVAGQAGLYLEVLGKGWREHPDHATRQAGTVTGTQDWSLREITVPVPGNSDVIRFGLTLTGPGRVWLRNPELRWLAPDDGGLDEAGPVRNGR